MTTDEIKTMQRRIGVTPDGFWGPKSIAACKEHLRQLMPTPNPWPKSDQASLRAFYGEPGDESNLVPITFPYPMYYDGKPVSRTRCHKKVAASLLRVLSAIRGIVAEHPEHKGEAEDYGGVFNFRPKRGGTSWSLHAWGAAIDLDADDNTFRDSWPMKADMPLEIMEAFAKEGWIGGGWAWGFDGMHFEACRR
jgi:hypothetical protein